MDKLSVAGVIGTASAVFLDSGMNHAAFVGLLWSLALGYTYVQKK
jgi:hypothetical protein